MLSAETHRGNREPIREGSYGRFLYNFYRTYDPDTGRYLEADPIGQLGGFNLYLYTGNQPMLYVDPWGLMNIGSWGPMSFGRFYNCVKNVNATAGVFSVPGAAVAPDASKHCFASCEIARSCGWGTWGSALVGLGKEVFDTVVPARFGGGNAEFRDLLNDAAGNICATSGTNPCCQQTQHCCQNQQPTCQECCSCLAQSGELF
jgi:RHS repeat-associated protein